MSKPASVDCTKECSEPGCANNFKKHRWGSSAAAKAGWFLQKNGDCWCPEHNPDWVKEWREKRKKV